MRQNPVLVLVVIDAIVAFAFGVHALHNKRRARRELERIRDARGRHSRQVFS